MFQRPYNILLWLVLAVANLWLWEHAGYTSAAVLAGLLAIFAIVEACVFIKESTHGKI